MRAFFILFLYLGFFLSLQAEPPREGLYKVSVSFGGETFTDLLTVEEKGKGTFTVPGVFTKGIQILNGQSSFEFELNATEGGQPFSFLFKAFHVEKDFFRGDIINLKIGTFTGGYLYDNSTCP